MKRIHILTAATLAGLALATAPQAASAQAAPNGETLFRQRCQSCHSASSAKPSTIAPNLAGVVGRKAASTPYSYSPALKKSGLIWTKANLDKYLTAPARLVPGTRMVIAVSDATQRAALIQYLSKTR